MFKGASSFNRDISKWDVVSVKDMQRMFYDAESFNGDVSEWNVGKVTTMYQMFLGASAFTQTLCGRWYESTANKVEMFDGSSGKICSAPTTTTGMSTDYTCVAKDCYTVLDPHPHSHSHASGWAVSAPVSE